MASGTVSDIDPQLLAELAPLTRMLALAHDEPIEGIPKLELCLLSGSSCLFVTERVLVRDELGA